MTGWAHLLRYAIIAVLLGFLASAIVSAMSIGEALGHWAGGAH